MSTINIDVMKQLLQEFVEKEALASEEINVVRQQIEELEQRIKACQEKLKVVSEDKDQIGAMLKRYAGGIAAVLGSKGSLSSATPQSTAPASSPAAAPVESLAQQSVSGNMTNLAQALSDANPSQGQAQKPEAAGKPGASKLLDGVLHSAAAQGSESPANNSASPQAAEKPAEAPAEESSTKADEAPEDEAVKSINDALRGLFR